LLKHVFLHFNSSKTVSHCSDENTTTSTATSTKKEIGNGFIFRPTIFAQLQQNLLKTFVEVVANVVITHNNSHCRTRRTHFSGAAAAKNGKI
jgi:hypothetical protein